VEGSQGHSSTIFGAQRGAEPCSRRRGSWPPSTIGCGADLSYNPSLILGGSQVEYDPGCLFRAAPRAKTNVVPGRVVVAGDLRFLSREQLERARSGMRSIVAQSLPRTSASIQFEDGMPSMEPARATRAAGAAGPGLARPGRGADRGARPFAAGRGRHLLRGAARGRPRRPGRPGGQEHAPGEYLELDALPILIRRAALLMQRLR